MLGRPRSFRNIIAQILCAAFSHLGLAFPDLQGVRHFLILRDHSRASRNWDMLFASKPYTFCFFRRPPMVRSGAFHFAKLGNNLVLRSGAVCSTDSFPIISNKCVEKWIENKKFSPDKIKKEIAFWIKFIEKWNMSKMCANKEKKWCLSIFKMALFFWNKVYIKKKWFVIDINLEKFLKWVFAFWEIKLKAWLWERIYAYVLPIITSFLTEGIFHGSIVEKVMDQMANRISRQFALRDTET